MISINIGFDGWKWKLAGVVIIIVAFILYQKTKATSDTSDLASVAKEWILVKSDGCGFCVKQLEILGPSKHLFKILDSNEDKELIDKLKFPKEGVPLWINTKTKNYKVGLLQLEEIKNLKI